MKCFECDAPADINHHVVPRIRGGQQTVALCTDCHRQAHEISMADLMHEGRVRREEEARRAGPYAWGDGATMIQPTTLHQAIQQRDKAHDDARKADARLVEAMRSCRKDGMTLQAIGDVLGLTRQRVKQMLDAERKP